MLKKKYLCAKKLTLTQSEMRFSLDDSLRNIIYNLLTVCQQMTPARLKMLCTNKAFTNCIFTTYVFRGFDIKYSTMFLIP